MTSGIFVAGTDTGVGKTAVSLGLMQAWQSAGYRVAAMKPVASGCEQTTEGLVNDDARRLLRQSSIPQAYDLVNPCAFEPPIAPHLAAAAIGREISTDEIGSAYRQLAGLADKVVVEGVGGWLVPIDEKQTMADVVVQLGIPVILVVAIRLGCLNHALLTVAAIESMGVPMMGWVANRMDPACSNQDENVQALEQRLKAVLLADLPYQQGGLSPLTIAKRLESSLARMPG